MTSPYIIDDAYEQARLKELRRIIARLLPKGSRVSTQKLAKAAFNAEWHINANAPPPTDLRRMFHPLKVRASKDAQTIAKHLAAMDKAWGKLMLSTQAEFAAGLEARGIDPQVAMNALNALHEIAKANSKKPKPLKQGNTQKPIGHYTLTIWDVLRASGSRSMRAGGRFVSQLLIESLPWKFKGHDPYKLEERCYQLIRESFRR